MSDERMAEQAMLLVADDDPAVRQSLERTLTREGYGVVLAPDGQAALDRLRQGGIDLLLSDLKMPGLTGLELLKQAREAAPDVDVILLTAFGTVEEAVRAMKDGAIDFLTKPLQRAQLVRVIRQALERRSLIQQNRALQQRLDDLLREGKAIGVSYAFKQMMTLVEQVADSSASVLIQGESGTGKELAARDIHDRSPRRNGPFIAVNCAALPETLLESELFGYEKGAFTGAETRKKGRFELAEGGTLFLDEIGDINPATQVKLLRVLQEREFERVGGTETIKANVRVVAATNKDLERAMAAGTFREDLYYRLNVFTLFIPPLRERKADMLLLVDHFLEKFAREHKRNIKRISTPAIDMLASYHWPGNVRELENTLERAVLMCDGEVVHGHHLPPSLQTAEASGTITRVSLRDAVSAYEKDLIQDALKTTRGNRAKAARLLDSTERIINYKVKEYGIDARRFKS